MNWLVGINYKYHRLRGFNLMDNVSLYKVFPHLGKVHLIWQGGGAEDIEGGAPTIFRNPKGGAEKIRGVGSEKLYTSNPKGGGGGS